VEVQILTGMRFSLFEAFILAQGPACTVINKKMWELLRQLDRNIK